MDYPYYVRVDDASPGDVIIHPNHWPTRIDKITLDGHGFASVRGPRLEPGKTVWRYRLDREASVMYLPVTSMVLLLNHGDVKDGVFSAVSRDLNLAMRPFTRGDQT